MQFKLFIIKKNNKVIKHIFKMYMLITAIPSEAFSIKAILSEEKAETIALHIVKIEDDALGVLMREYVNRVFSLSNITPPYRDGLTSHLQEKVIFDSEDMLSCEGMASHDACFARRW